MHTDLKSVFEFAAPPRSVRFRSVGAMLSMWGARVLALALGGIPFYLWWFILGDDSWQREQQISPGCCVGIAFTIPWAAGMVLVWYPSLRERWIMRQGVGGVGSVTQMEVKYIKGRPYYLIWYRFPAADGQTWGNKAKVSRDMFDELQKGQAVIVVYLKDRPLKSVLYEASYYRPR